MSKFTPHEYQEKAIEFLVSNNYAGLFLSPGLGKTAITYAAFKVLKKVGFVERMLVVAPLRPCYAVWPREARKWDDFNDFSVGVLHGANKLKTLNKKHDVYVINPEGLRWLFTTLRGNLPFDMLVVDECFPKGTMVSTPTGLVDISNIQDGDTVHTAIGPNKVLRISKKVTTSLVKLETEKGFIISTPEHPIFTTGGWRCAKDCEGFEILDIEQVSNLWNNVRSAEESPGAKLSRSLFEILLAEADVGRASGAASTASRSNATSYDRAHYLEQGGAMGGGSHRKVEEEGERKWAEREVFENSSREWYGDDKMRRTFKKSTTEHIPVELPNSIGEEARRLSYELQSGFWKSRNESGGRSRWGESQQPKHEGERYKEGREIVGARVDSITYLECGSGEDVFNLEVEGHPSFYANGFLVHNCSKFKHINTERFKTLKPYLGKFKRRVILTGSPAANSLLDIFGQIFILDLGKALSPFITHFRTKFFVKTSFDIPHPNPEKALNGVMLTVNNWHSTPEKAESLYAHIAPLVLRMSSKDYLKMPDLLVNDIYIDLPPKARAIYDQLENTLRLDFKQGRVTAANAAVKLMKCRQVANGGIFLDSAERKWEKVHAAKSEVVEELVEELEGSPALVAYEFHHDRERLLETLGKDTPFIGGGVSGKISDKIITAWNKGEVRVLLGQPNSMAHGLNMQESGDTVIFHSLIWSFEDYDQFIQRVWRQGKGRPVTVHRIIAKDTVDEVVIAALERKDKDQNALFNALKNYWG